MKKIIIVFICLLFCLSGFSQSQIDVRLGFTASFLGGDYNHQTLRAGGLGGITGDIHLGDGVWYLRSGLLYCTKGGIQDISEYGYKQSFCMNYLELPFQVALKFGSKNRKRFCAAYGIFWGYGLAGKMSCNNSDLTTNLFGDEQGDFYKFDVGEHFDFGVNCNRVYIGLSFSQGHKNILRYTEASSTARTRSLSLNLAITLKKFD